MENKIYGWIYLITNLINGKGRNSKDTIQKMIIAQNRPRNIEIRKENNKKKRGKSRKNSTSIYCGVIKHEKYYSSKIRLNNTSIYLGSYNLETDAAKSYDIAAIKYFGHDCNLNFPELREKYLNNEIIINKRPNHDYSNSTEKYIFFSKKYKKWIFRWFNKKLNKCKEKSFINIQDAVKYRDFIFLDLNNSSIKRKK